MYLLKALAWSTGHRNRHQYLILLALEGNSHHQQIRFPNSTDSDHYPYPFLNAFVPLSSHQHHRHCGVGSPNNSCAPIRKNNQKQQSPKAAKAEAKHSLGTYPSYKYLSTYVLPRLASCQIKLPCSFPQSNPEPRPRLGL